jgi:hypothetical protein
MRKLSGLMAVFALAAALATTGCFIVERREKETRSISVEGPEKKREIKVETTDK